MFDKPEQVLHSWLDGINSGAVDKAVSLYSENAVLLPTFSDKSLTDCKDREIYFAKLAAYKKLSVKLHDKFLLTQSLSSRLFIMNGIYCWRFELEGELLSFEARFTMAVDLDRPRPIINHHSSQIPRTL